MFWARHQDQLESQDRAIISFLEMIKDKKKKKKKGDDITEAMRGSVSNQFGKYGSPGLYCNFSDCRVDMAMIDNNDDQ